MLSLKNLSIAHGANVLIEHLDLTVFKKNIIGIIGANGSGKSSLFSAIRGTLDPAKGEILFSSGFKMMSLEQEVVASEISAIDYVISGDKALSQVLETLREAEAAENYEMVMQCHTQLHDMDGYSVESRAAKILIGLGFSQEELSAPVKQFSGGWRMRLNLAKCLLAPSDLLLLDEPTNHLDMEAIIWLENFLKNYQGAILMVSHDQDFLDNTVTHIAHIENKALKLYTGNFSSFELLRAQYIAAQNAQYKRQQIQITHMMKYVDRFRYKSSKAKQAQSRLKLIEKMELVKPIYEQSPFHFKFLPPERMPNPILSMTKVDLGYEENHPIIKRVTLSMMAAQRIGLLGVNGAGKSTFIKSVCGEIQTLRGVIQRPSGLKIGYFAQHQVDHLPLDTTPLSLIKELDKTKYEKDLINYLASFGFSRDQSLSPLKIFSGGEKSRIALALLIWQRPNLLLLDEPTNHLDLETRQALMYALQEYEGTMILVAHDRHLMRTLVDELYLINNGQLTCFDGTVEDYQAMVV